jgi:hypothetical protein
MAALNWLRDGGEATLMASCTASLADEAPRGRENMICGANRDDFHLRNVTQGATSPRATPIYALSMPAKPAFAVASLLQSFPESRSL